MLHLLLLCTMLNSSAMWCTHEALYLGVCMDPSFSTKRYRISDCRFVCKEILDTDAVSYYLEHKECKIADEHLVACTSNEISVGRFKVSIAVLKTLMPSGLKNRMAVIWRVGKMKYLDPRRGYEFDSMLDVVMKCKKGRSMFRFGNDCPMK